VPDEHDLAAGRADGVDGRDDRVDVEIEQVLEACEVAADGSPRPQLLSRV
jgi:hypothetical protein